MINVNIVMINIVNIIIMISNIFIYPTSRADLNFLIYLSNLIMLGQPWLPRAPAPGARCCREMDKNLQNSLPARCVGIIPFSDLNLQNKKKANSTFGHFHIASASVFVCSFLCLYLLLNFCHFHIASAFHFASCGQKG